MNLSGNYLKGYEGVCRRCHKSERAYYYFADTQHRRLMKDKVFMAIDANCPTCVTNKFFQSPHTMEWKRELKPIEVKKDLERLEGGIHIDFEAAEEQSKQETKLDIAIDNDEKRSQELYEYAKKKDLLKSTI